MIDDHHDDAHHEHGHGHGHGHGHEHDHGHDHQAPMAPLPPTPEHGYWKSIREPSGNAPWQLQPSTLEFPRPPAEAEQVIDLLSRRNFFHLMQRVDGARGCRGLPALREGRDRPTRAPSRGPGPGPDDGVRDRLGARRRRPRAARDLVRGPADPPRRQRRPPVHRRRHRAGHEAPRRRDRVRAGEHPPPLRPRSLARADQGPRQGRDDGRGPRRDSRPGRGAQEGQRAHPQRGDVVGHRGAAQERVARQQPRAAVARVRAAVLGQPGAARGTWLAFGADVRSRTSTAA